MIGMSLSAYARRQGCSVEAVSKSVRHGRLTEKSVQVVDGKPRIVDVAAADREWQSNRAKPAPKRERASEIVYDPPEVMSVFRCRGAVCVVTRVQVKPERFAWAVLSPADAVHLAQRLIDAAAGKGDIAG